MTRILVKEAGNYEQTPLAGTLKLPHDHGDCYHSFGEISEGSTYWMGRETVKRTATQSDRIPADRCLT